MRLRFLTAGLAAAVLANSLMPPPAAAAPAPDPGSARARTVVVPTLERRATLSADYRAPGPPSGALATPANGRTGPFPGQVIPGFSGVLDNGNGTFWGLPDNGFGSKANSADFLLRMYRVRPAWETSDGGPGRIRVQRSISLRDPDRRIPWPIVNQNTPGRLLTGADFDVESVVRGAGNTFWIGEEFGPFLLHVDRAGRLLRAPVPFPGGKSPDNPTLGTGTANVPRSRGFEALAVSRNGRFLYPIVEGALVDDPVKRRRWIYEFDTRSERYTGQRWAYETDQAGHVIGDAYLTARRQLLLVERDDFEGPAAVTKRVYRVDLNRTDSDGNVAKSLVVDLLQIANPDRVGTDSSPGAYGVGEAFSFPFQSVETVVPLPGNRLLIANDNNYPGNDARYPGTPDDTEMIVLRLDKQRVEPGQATAIAHRGASAYRPEHTLAAYALGIRQCADFIEPDVVPTKDGVLVARHENEISSTTDVATRAEFAGRKVTKTIDGVAVTGWFTEDFTLAELKTLRAKERVPNLRPESTAYDGLYEVPTLDEVVDLARHSRTCTGERVGVYPETKHPTYFAAIGLPMERELLRVLEAGGYAERTDPVFIQSFETTNLKALARRTDIRLVQLVNCAGAPYDLRARGDLRTYADLVTRQGLRQISRYADGVGLCKDVMIPRDAAGRLRAPTPVIADAHAAGLTVHGWTFRLENVFLPLEFRRGTDPNAPGDLAGEIRVFLDAGMDGFFTDNPDIGWEVVTEEDVATAVVA